MKLNHKFVRTVTTTAAVLGAAAMLSVGAFAAEADINDPAAAGYLPPQEQMVQGDIALHSADVAIGEKDPTYGGYGAPEGNPIQGNIMLISGDELAAPSADAAAKKSEARYTVKGLFGKPTILNNVETYANVPQIILNGWEWFSSIGTERSKGTKVFCLVGKINNTGLVEIPMGTTLREIVEDIGGGIPNGKKFKAAQTGGPSGGCIPASLIDTPIDYDNLIAIGSMMGSGGLIVMDEDTCMVDIAKFFLEFTVDESCGKCTPCRIGNKRLLEILDRITRGLGRDEDLDELQNLARVIRDSSLCALGQTAPNPVLSTLENFWDEYVAHVRDHHCTAHRCRDLMSFVIDPKVCKGCSLCARMCPPGAISGIPKQPYAIDQARCIKCGTCLEKCKFGAISIR